MALLFLRDESLPALWSLCGLVLEDGRRPGDVRDAAAELQAELLSCMRLPDAERREREASARAIRASRAPAPLPVVPRWRWSSARVGALVLGLGALVVAAALAGGRLAALVAGGAGALGGGALLWGALLVAAARKGGV